MVKVQFTATVYNPDTEETFTGWVDTQWSMFELRTDSTDVREFEFDTLEQAEEFIDSEIGSVTAGDRGSYYAEDARMNLETGENWSYAAHVTEL